MFGYAIVALIVAGGLFLLAARFLPAGEQIAPALRDEPIWSLPAERSLTYDEVAEVRLPVALRGYRFAETDLLLDRLGEELKARDAEIARLRGHRPSPGTGATVQHEPQGSQAPDEVSSGADTEIVEDIPDDLPEDVLDEMPEGIVEDSSEPTSQDMAEDIAEDTPEDIAETEKAPDGSES